MKPTLPVPPLPMPEPYDWGWNHDAPRATVGSPSQTEIRLVIDLEQSRIEQIFRPRRGTVRHEGAARWVAALLAAGWAVRLRAQAKSIGRPFRLAGGTLGGGGFATINLAYPLDTREESYRLPAYDAPDEAAAMQRAEEYARRRSAALLEFAKPIVIGSLKDEAAAFLADSPNAQELLNTVARS